MLLKFKISNYKSIQDIAIDFSFAEKKAPNRYKELNYHPFIGNDKIRVVPCLDLHGANASGKSNIVKALIVLQKIVTAGLAYDLYHPNVIQNCNDITSFELSFYFENKIFVYTLAYDSEQIVKESLASDGKIIFNIENHSHDLSNLTNSSYSAEKLKEIFYIESLDKHELFKRTFLSILGRNYANLNKDVSLAYSYIVDNLEVHESNNFPFSFVMRKLTDIDDDKKLSEAFERILALLKKLDIGITKMEYRRKKLKDPHTISPNSYENTIDKVDTELSTTDIKIYRLNYANEEVSLPFNNESLGTKKLAPLLALILYVLDNGLVLVIDEIGNSIHSLLLAEMIRLFKDKRYNKSNAQLIFTTHNTDVMDHELMRISEIGIINKTLKKGTTIVRVSDFDGIRNVTRFRKQYLDGRFSGIPFPYI